MEYYTYILKSVNHLKTYVGHTDNIRRRLKEHNDGTSYFSSRFKPWKVIYLEMYSNINESIEREKYFKSRVGRRWIKKYLFS